MQKKTATKEVIHTVENLSFENQKLIDTFLNLNWLHSII